MAYQDFHIHIGNEVTAGYPITLVSTPIGAIFEVTHQSFPRGVTPIAELADQYQKNRLSTEEIKILGKSLFSFLFSSTLNRHFLASLEVAQEGIRIRLQIMPEELARLPWELLYDEEVGALALNPHTPIIRHWSGTPTIRPRPLSKALRGILAFASPQNLPKLAIEAERDLLLRVFDVMNKDSKPELKMVFHAKKSDLKMALQDDIHFLHFAGHGFYNEPADEGGLVLEDDYGNSDLLTGEKLVELLRGQTIPLVVMGSCNSSNISPAVQAILRTGLPAVISMQTQIADQSAYNFSVALYRDLAEGISLEKAITNARKAMNTLPGDWGAPVLSMAPSLSGDRHLVSNNKNFLYAHRLPPGSFYPIEQRLRDLDRVLNQLKLGENTVLLSGLGGIGKTAMAVETVRQCMSTGKAGSWDGFTWASAKQEMFNEGEIVRLSPATITFEDLLNTIGTQIGQKNIAGLSLKEKMAFVAEKVEKNRYLVVVDNLETFDEAQELVNQLSLILKHSRSQALISSRRVVGGDLWVQNLHGLDEENASVFIRREGMEKNIPEVLIASPKDLRIIYEITGGNPLAMKLVVGQIRVLDLPLVLRQLKTGSGDLYRFIFYESWKMLSDNAQILLRYIATSPNSISWGELEEVGMEYIGIGPQKLSQALTDLGSLSLIEVERSLSKRYSTHPLTRQFVNNDLPVIWKEEGLI